MTDFLKFLDEDVMEMYTKGYNLELCMLAQIIKELKPKYVQPKLELPEKEVEKVYPKKKVAKKKGGRKPKVKMDLDRYHI